MAIQPYRTGPCIVTFNAIAIGYSEDGATIRLEPRYLDVYSDRYGGRSGVPADSQILGVIARVTVDLTEYDSAEAQKLGAFKKAGTAGTIPTIGAFVREDALYATLLLDGDVDYTFSQAFLRDGQEFNAGARHQTYRAGWECWINSPSSLALFSIA